jgi:hypothetical protein
MENRGILLKILSFLYVVLGLTGWKTYNPGQPKFANPPFIYLWQLERQFLRRSG